MLQFRRFRTLYTPLSIPLRRLNRSFSNTSALNRAKKKISARVEFACKEYAKMNDPLQSCGKKVQTISSKLLLLVKTNQLDDLLNSMRTAPLLNLAICNKILSTRFCLSLEKEAEMKESMLEIMRNRKIVLDSVSVFIMILLCKKAGSNIENVERIFNRLKEGGIEPSIQVYYLMINCYLNEDNRLGDVERLFTEMFDCGIESKKNAYFSMIHTYAKHGWLEKVEEHYSQMLSDGIKPDLDTYQYMINGFLKVCRQES